MILCPETSTKLYVHEFSFICKAEALYTPEAAFFDEIQTKVLRVFLLVIHSHLYSFAWDFYFFKLMQPHTIFYSSVTVHFKGERRKSWKPYSLPYGLRNSYRNLKSENTQDYAQKPKRNWMFMNSASACGGGGNFYHDNAGSYMVGSREDV